MFKSKVYLKEKKKEILDKTIINWSLSQSKINLNNKTNFFKTHNMLCKIKINDKPYSFTSLENTLGVIHIVRDPRNILTSLKNHFGITDDESALRFMFNEDFFATYAHILLLFDRSTETRIPFSIIFFLLEKISFVFLFIFFKSLSFK